MKYTLQKNGVVLNSCEAETVVDAARILLNKPGGKCTGNTVALILRDPPGGVEVKISTLLPYPLWL